MNLSTIKTFSDVWRLVRENYRKTKRCIVYAYGGCDNLAIIDELYENARDAEVRFVTVIDPRRRDLFAHAEKLMLNHRVFLLSVVWFREHRDLNELYEETRLNKWLRDINDTVASTSASSSTTNHSANFLREDITDNEDDADDDGSGEEEERAGNSEAKNLDESNEPTTKRRRMTIKRKKNYECDKLEDGETSIDSIHTRMSRRLLDDKTLQSNLDYDRFVYIRYSAEESIGSSLIKRFFNKTFMRVKKFVIVDCVDLSWAKNTIVLHENYIDHLIYGENKHT